jgi:ATP-dependent DNA helicase RecG
LKPISPNTISANAFFRAGEIETWGRGIQRIVDACKEAGTPAPIIDYKPNDLWIEFPFSPEYLEAISTDGTRAGEGKNPSTQVTPQVTPQVATLLKVLRGEMNREQLQEALGLRARKNFRLLYLMPSLEAGLIERTIPDKPTSRLQKYRLTEKGRSLLH